MQDVAPFLIYVQPSSLLAPSPFLNQSRSSDQELKHGMPLNKSSAGEQRKNNSRNKIKDMTCLIFLCCINNLTVATCRNCSLAPPLPAPAKAKIRPGIRHAVCGIFIFPLTRDDVKVTPA